MERRRSSIKSGSLSMLTFETFLSYPPSKTDLYPPCRRKNRRREFRESVFIIVRKDEGGKRGGREGRNRG